MSEIRSSQKKSAHLPDNDSIIKFIYGLETEYPVDTFCQDDLHIWPLLRLALFSEIRNAGTRNRPCQFLPASFKYCIDRLKAFRADIKKEEIKLEKAAAAIRDTDVLLFSRVPAYQVEQQGQEYDKILDPVIDLLQGKVTWKKFHVRRVDEDNRRPQIHPGVVLPVTPVRALRQRARPVVISASLSTAIRMLEASVESHFDLKINLADAVTADLEDLIAYRDYFLAALQGAKCRLVILPCYYGKRQAGLVWACHRLGIKTMDIQHGKQGCLNIGYGQWSRVPDQGYELFPDIFWVWGKDSQENLKIGKPGQTCKPSIMIGGNLFLSHWVNGAPYEYRRDNPAFWQRLENAQRVLLVTLQPFTVHKAVPEHLLDAIKRSPPEWLWLLRMHPTHKPDQQSIMDWLNTWGISMDCLEITQASRQPLYALMKHTHVHMTLWSSSGYEALHFNVPTIFLSADALALYADYLEKGIFYYADNPDDILNRVADLDFRPVSNERDYIETDQAFAEQLMSTALQ